MRIIGLKLDRGNPSVVKNLNPGWYPFGDYIEPTEQDEFPWKNTIDEETIYSQMYKEVSGEAFSPTFRLSVSCIVGKNGSGKTTLLELVFRIINNFAFYVFSKKNNTVNKQNGELPLESNLIDASGFSASLYFETDGYFGKIAYNYGNVDYCYLSNNSRSQVLKGDFNLYIDKGFIKNVLSGFFYTICSNYSIYSLNQYDYNSIRLSLPEGIDNIDGAWIHGLLHKNDGYLTPLVITPFRDVYGNIDIDNEKELAKQRLSTFALLFQSQCKSFLGVYKADYIEYRFDDQSILKFQNRFLKLCQERIPLNKHSEILVGLTRAWEDQLRKIDPKLINYDDKVFTSIITYLAYKTLKISLNFKSFGIILGTRPLSQDEKVIARTKWESDILQKSKWHDDLLTNMFYLDITQNAYFLLIKKILSEHSHITLKIEQMLTFLKSKILKANLAPKNSELYLTSVHKIKTSEYIHQHISKYNEGLDDSNKINSYQVYDEVYKILPPPIFEWEIFYSKKGLKVDEEMTNGISLASLSSGEKQLLYSLSYIIYHIKNIENIETDKYRFRYHHINVVMDEAELYYHPDFQRVMLSEAIKMLSTCHIDSRKIRSINFIMVTHSPFVLSDIPNNRILYLDNGSTLSRNTKTFSANIHELLYSHFFITKPMGEVAFVLEQKIINFYNNLSNKNNEEIKSFFSKIGFYREIVHLIGEEYLYNTLNKMLDAIEIEFNKRNFNGLNVKNELLELRSRIKFLESIIEDEKNKLQ